VNWNIDSFKVLSRVVDRKFDEFRANDSGRSPCNSWHRTSSQRVLDEWKEYLALHGIERVPAGFRKQGCKETYVWMECPWSVRNSVPGAVHTKSNLYFPLELAEKIVFLEGMP
jgi:hypothetical protein